MQHAINNLCYVIDQKQKISASIIIVYYYFSSYDEPASSFLSFPFLFFFYLFFFSTHLSIWFELDLCIFLSVNIFKIFFIT